MDFPVRTLRSAQGIPIYLEEYQIKPLAAVKEFLAS